MGTGSRSAIGLRTKARFDARAMGCAESCGWRRSWGGWRVFCREMVSQGPQGKSGETVARRVLVCERIGGGWAWVSSGGSWQDPERWAAGGEKSVAAGGLSGAAARGVRAGRGLAPTGARRASIVGCRQNWEPK